MIVLYLYEIICNDSKKSIIYQFTQNIRYLTLYIYYYYCKMDSYLNKHFSYATTKECMQMYELTSPGNPMVVLLNVLALHKKMSKYTSDIIKPLFGSEFTHYISIPKQCFLCQHLNKP